MKENREGPAKPRRNERDAYELELLERCLAAVQEEVGGLTWKRKRPDGNRQRQVDGYVEARLGEHRLPYAVEVKPMIRLAHVGALVQLAKKLRDERLLVCARRIPKAVGEALREKEVAYVDLGGNAYLRAPGLYLFVDGRRPAAHELRARPNLTGAEIKLLGVFLRDPDAGEAIQQELADRAGIALGLIGKGRNKLVELRILEPVGKRQWRVADRVEGLRRFADGWATTLRPKLRPQRYRMLKLEDEGGLERRMAEVEPDLGCLLGGERAAGRLTRFLRTDRATIHTPPAQQRKVAKALKLVPAEEGPITLLARYGLGDDYRLPRQPVPLAHPLLVWAECLTIPDERVAGVATKLYENYLVPRNA